MGLEGWLRKLVSLSGEAPRKDVLVEDIVVVCDVDLHNQCDTALLGVYQDMAETGSSYNGAIEVRAARSYGVSFGSLGERARRKVACGVMTTGAKGQEAFVVGALEPRDTQVKEMGNRLAMALAGAFPDSTVNVEAEAVAGDEDVYLVGKFHRLAWVPAAEDDIVTDGVRLAFCYTVDSDVAMLCILSYLTAQKEADDRTSKTIAVVSTNQGNIYLTPELCRQVDPADFFGLSSDFCGATETSLVAGVVQASTSSAVGKELANALARIPETIQKALLAYLEVTSRYECDAAAFLESTTRYLKEDTRGSADDYMKYLARPSAPSFSHAVVMGCLSFLSLKRDIPDISNEACCKLYKRRFGVDPRQGASTGPMTIRADACIGLKLSNGPPVLVPTPDAEFLEALNLSDSRSSAEGLMESSRKPLPGPSTVPEELLCPFKNGYYLVDDTPGYLSEMCECILNCDEYENIGLEVIKTRIGYKISSHTHFVLIGARDEKTVRSWYDTVIDRFLGTASRARERAPVGSHGLESPEEEARKPSKERLLGG